MSYHKVGWLEQCWYVIRWKIKNLLKKGRK